MNEEICYERYQKAKKSTTKIVFRCKSKKKLRIRINGSTKCTANPTRRRWRKTGLNL